MSAIDHPSATAGRLPVAARKAPSRRSAVSALLATGLIAAAALAGCSSSNGGSKSAGPADRAPANGLAAGAPTAADNGKQDKASSGSGTAVQLPEAPAQNTGRDIIYTGTISVRVSNVDGAANQLGTLATGAGGYVSADQRTAEGDKASATVTVRVPSGQFTPFLGSVSRLGTELTRQLSAEDVTAKMVDINARLKTQQASVNRIRALMAQAKTIGDVTMLEGELSNREADLESLEAQQRSLVDLTALSTITVTLLAPETPVTKPAKKHNNGFLSGLTAGWHAFLGALKGLLIVLGAILPFVIAIGLPLWLVMYLLRRRRAAPAATTPVEPTD